MGFWQLNTVDAAPVVADRTALKALDTSLYQTAFLTESGRSGQFIFRSGNYSTQITADTLEGIYVKATDTASSAGSWVRVYTGPANVKWFGAMGDNSAADLSSLQAATDLCDDVYIPDGTYKINGPWLLDDNATLIFESRSALIKSSETSSSSAILRARGTSSTRNFYITIKSGMLQGPVASGVTGIDFLSTSYGLIDGTFISQCGDGIKIGGSGSLGAFYNRMTDCIITDVAVGIRCGTLGNENVFRGIRIGSCVIGTDDDDNTCNTYEQVAIEVFSTAGHRVCNTAAVSQRIRYINSRLENVGGVGIGIDIKAAAQGTVVIGEFYTGVATGVQDGSASTDHLAAY